jgi:uracil-DNA glycosylase family 4
LAKSRINTVFGEGSENAKIVLVGEAPGAEEDKSGLPFVGKSGKLLEKMLLAIGIEKEDVFICNVLKCRPPGNRDPKQNEIDKCSPYLTKQLEILNGELDTKNNQNELLLREIHHRVKNNLELVKSLITLQSAELEDSATKDEGD